MGGLLNDTLAYNFLKSVDTFDNKGVTSYGEHVVECYAIKNNIVVAKPRISVPIE